MIINKTTNNCDYKYDYNYDYTTSSHVEGQHLIWLTIKS
jgi:hypothetical protein